jgi:hypothetical protein
MRDPGTPGINLRNEFAEIPTRVTVADDTQENNFP